MTLPGCVGVREPRERLERLFQKNVIICPTLACTSHPTTPPHPPRAYKCEKNSLYGYVYEIFIIYVRALAYD